MNKRCASDVKVAQNDRFDNNTIAESSGGNRIKKGGKDFEQKNHFNFNGNCFFNV